MYGIWPYPDFVAPLVPGDRRGSQTQEEEIKWVGCLWGRLLRTDIDYSCFLRCYNHPIEDFEDEVFEDGSWNNTQGGARVVNLANISHLGD